MFSFDLIKGTAIPQKISKWLLKLQILQLIVCKPGCNFINFEINLSFLIKPFFYVTKKSRLKFKYLEN